MALDTYSGIVASISNWLDRDDLVALIPDFISLAELRINRKLRVIDMEAEAKTPLVDGQVAYALPCDYVSARSISIDSQAGNMSYITPDVMDTLTTTTQYDVLYYTIIGGQIVLNTSGSGNLVVKYFKKYPHLSTSNETNWMTTNAYDVLLYGSLLEAEAWLMTDERIPLWKTAFDTGMEDLNDAAEEGRFAGDAMSIRSVS